MAENPEENPSGSTGDTIDLSSLSGADFGPSWVDGKSSTKTPRSADRPHRERRSSGPPGRDRRGDGRQRSGDRRPPRGPRRSEGQGAHAAREGGDSHRPAFQPTVKVDLYPQDEAFDALVGRLRASARTYQLFEIAQLILEKPERFVAVVSNFPAKGEKSVADLFFSVPGHLPFETEDEAVDHVMANHLDLFFDTEEVEVEPPKGNFQMVNRCPVTGELLGPPNYHRYQEFVQRHYASRIHGMSFDRFLSKVETVKEQESIDAWVEKMKKGVRFVLKDRKEGEPETLESPEAARRFLLAERREQVVGSGESVRFAGRDIDRLPRGDIRRSVESYIEHQRHFPLDTANNLRGRLRRQKFTVYKKGSKGVSYVCSVKRKFRDGKTVFTDSIRGLIEFIEKNPMVPAARVAADYLGIEAEQPKPERLKVTEGEIAAAREEKAEEGQEERAPDAPAEGVEGAAEAPAAEKPAAVNPATPVERSLSDESREAFKRLMLDLRWLVTEGYVTEYGDGTLFAPPPLPERKKEPEPAAKQKSAPADGEPAAVEPAAAAAATTEGAEAATPAEPGKPAPEAPCAPAAIESAQDETAEPESAPEESAAVEPEAASAAATEEAEAVTPAEPGKPAPEVPEAAAAIESAQDETAEPESAPEEPAAGETVPDTDEAGEPKKPEPDGGGAAGSKAP